MTEKKMTKREYINRILGYAHEEDKPFLTHELELLDKKNDAPRKPTPKQVENLGFQDDIVAWMEPGVSYDAATITKGIPSLVAAGVSSARVVGMLGQLRKAGKVEYRQEKGKGFYTLA